MQTDTASAATIDEVLLERELALSLVALPVLTREDAYRLLDLDNGR